MNCIKFEKVLKLNNSNDVYNEKNYEGLEDGYYLVDDGVSYILVGIFDNGGGLRDVNVFFMKRECVILGSVEDNIEKLAYEIRSLVDNRYEKLLSEVHQTYNRVEDLFTDNSSSNNNNSNINVNDLTRLIAVAQKPELIKE